MTDATPSERKAESTSLGDLLSEVTADLSTLMRQEVALAKAELRESATQAGRGAGMLGGAAYGAMMAIFFLSVALWWAIPDRPRLVGRDRRCDLGRHRPGPVPDRTQGTQEGRWGAADGGDTQAHPRRREEK